MKIFKIHLKVLIGFAIAIAGIGFFLYTTYKNSQLSISDSQNIKHELKIMHLAEDILNNAQNLETSYRGFVITGEEMYLEPAKKSLKILPKSVIELQIVSSGDTTTNQTAARIKNCITAKINYANEIIALRKQNKIE